MLTTEPTRIVAGDSAAWTIALADYPASAGWSLVYTFVSPTGKAAATSAASGDAHAVSLSPTFTAALTPADYAWQAKAERGSGSSLERYTVRNGWLTIARDIASAPASGYDARGHAARTVAAIEAWIESHDAGVAEYEIQTPSGARKMKFIPTAELLALLDRYRAEARAERAAEAVGAASGITGKIGRVLVRF